MSLPLRHAQQIALDVDLVPQVVVQNLGGHLGAHIDHGNATNNACSQGRQDLRAYTEESTDPNRYTSKAKFCFCKDNKRMIIMSVDLLHIPRT